MNCQSCEALTINNVYCHELGCPDAWRDYTRECRECGGAFKPENADQVFCDGNCAAAWYGCEPVK